MSKSWFYLGIISSLAILTSSCGGDSDKKPAATAPAPATSPAPAAAPTAPTSTAAVPTPTTSPNPATPATTPGTPATTPSAASIKPISPDVTAGLIPSTEAENWSRTVAKGRPDPFAVLALQPVEVAIEGNSPQAASVKESSSTVKKAQSINPIATNSPAIKSGVDKPLPKMKISAKLPKASKSNSETPIVTEKSKVSIRSQSVINEKQKTPIKGQKFAMKGFVPGIKEEGFDAPGTGYLRTHNIPISAIPRTGINRSLPTIKVAIAKKAEVTKVPATNQKIATKPEPVAAKPLQAMAIEISGMIDVAGKTQVIVKLPTESFSRYVEVGERILNGKVLVKRVEGQNSLSPTVILEEVGVEVSRKIGEKLTPATPEAAPKP
jgi:hypothetical protein